MCFFKMFLNGFVLNGLNCFAFISRLREGKSKQWFLLGKKKRLGLAVLFQYCFFVAMVNMILQTSFFLVFFHVFFWMVVNGFDMSFFCIVSRVLRIFFSNFWCRLIQRDSNESLLDLYHRNVYTL